MEGDRIIDVGALSLVRGRHPAHEVLHFDQAALLPGFVNVHTHLELSVLRGVLEDMPFWEWIRRLTRIKYEVLTREDIRISAFLGSIEAVRSGITTLADPMDIGASLEAVLNTGLRAVLYQEVFSPKPEETETAMDVLKQKISELRKQKTAFGKDEDVVDRLGLWETPEKETRQARVRRVHLGVSPHSPYTVSVSLFQSISRFATTEGLPLCIHLAESQDESSLFEDGNGPIMDSYRQRGIIWNPPRCSPTQYLQRLGVIETSTLLVHCVRLRDEDFSILEQTRPAIAHCPKSNGKLRHGAMDLRRVRQIGLRIGLGTDSVASNNNMDLFEEMRAAYANPCWSVGYDSTPNQEQNYASAEDLLRMATLGGAEALQLESETGSVEEGKQADLIVVDLSQPHTTPVYSPVTALVFSARASDVLFTMVGGEALLQNGRLTGLKPGILTPLEEIRNKLLDASCQA